MREIVLDTETTGLNPAEGHRIVEIGLVEIANLIPTGRSFHVYLNPERDMPEEAFRVHGLSSEFLSTQKKFAEIAEEFRAFIEGARLIIHNAEFDVRFLNAELARLDAPPIDPAFVLDTLALARQRHPGMANSLDALCQRYGVDTSRREKHGALLDSLLLAEVYAELMGGRQASLQLTVARKSLSLADSGLLRKRPAPLPSRLSAEEAAAHRDFVASLGKQPIWMRYLESEQAEQGAA
ncbi:DNA polymerase III subunit epsilon [Methylocystis bryophila]|uniref:DNA polymerase III subunit epsilon n=1 Tax=Methylocystis bryophila TaxID=655015 RepID=A0A1W6MUS4_9HYPH|nr:DNA polymerase III subunit epsilon [Methylocystis bryophila]ARN81332.1 DNA polymerase III subunit epsilon [Methylocystis bryophila]BDV37314.1 DNA polymerase III subunit epsilon [Methylocystis bryophila]